MNVTLLEYPVDNDWWAVKERALVTIGKTAATPPSDEWKRDILRARHSPIRRLHFAFLLEDVPYWVSVHLCRHVHAQPYVRSQRNDRQDDYDRDNATQGAPVTMIWDMNAEELMVIANKRLCHQASIETRALVSMMCEAVAEHCPEFKPFLVPLCEYRGGVCPEMFSCGKCVRG